MDPDKILNEVDNANLKEELYAYQQIPVDSKFERARHKILLRRISMQKLRSRKSLIISSTDKSGGTNFFPEAAAVTSKKKHDKKAPGLSRGEFK